MNELSWLIQYMILKTINVASSNNDALKLRWLLLEYNIAFNYNIVYNLIQLDYNKLYYKIDYMIGYRVAWKYVYWLFVGIVSFNMWWSVWFTVKYKPTIPKVY